MKSALFFCLVAVGLAACASDPAADSGGWFRYDGFPVKGNATLERQFNHAYAMCVSSNKDVYVDCMSSRGFTDVPITNSSIVSAAPAAIPVAPTAISTASPDWRARAAEARALATQLRDPASKRMMVQIAETYDRLAAHQGAPAAPAR